MSALNRHNRTSRPLALVLAVLAALALVAAGCSDEGDSGSDSGSDESSSDSGSEPSPGAPEVPEECADREPPAGLAAAEERGEPDASIVEQATEGEPVVVAEGDGDALIPEGLIELHYSILKQSDGEVLDSTWQMGEPQEGSVASLPPSFAEGLDGMKVGGRRIITLPATDLYGEQLPPESGLTAEDNLVIVVDLVSVSEAGEGAGAGADPDALAAAEERGAPEMSVPEGEADTEQLVVIDDVEGDGEVVCPGDTVVAHYTGIQASDGEQFDSSWERGEPASFGLDAVIQGWSEGLVGMKVGGRRTLVIPADLAYGDESASGGPSGTLVFTVDLVGVE